MKKLFLTLFVATLFASCSAIPQEQSQNLEENVLPGTEVPENDKPGTEVPENEKPGTEVPENEKPGTELPEVVVPETQHQKYVKSFINITKNQDIYHQGGQGYFGYVDEKGTIVSKYDKYIPKEMYSSVKGKFERHSTYGGFLEMIELEIKNNNIVMTESDGRNLFYRLYPR